MKKTIILSIALIGLLNVSCEKDDVSAAVQQEESGVNTFSERLNSLYTTSFSGEGTFYSPTGLGNCSEEYPTDQMYAAMNKTQYNNSNACGAYIEVTRKGTSKKVIVKVLDQCPECPNGNVDLSKTAFLKLGTVAEGRIPITWKYIEQPRANNIIARIKTGSSQYYFAIQILNHKYMIKKFEIKNKFGVYYELPRQSYNYFLKRGGVFDGSGPVGPYDIRITDVNGSVVTKRINFSVDTRIFTGVQFPTTN